jgi:hypothetical protein
MRATISKRHVRRPADLTFPFGKSVVASCSLIVAILFTLAAIAEPKTGEIRPPALGWLLLIVLAIAIGTAFGVDSRRRKSRRPAASNSNQRNRVKRRGHTRESRGPGKC